MLGRTGCALARFFDRISRVLQSFADCAFGGLGAVLYCPAGGLCTMLNSLACFFRGFSYGLAGFLDWPLILCSRDERYAKRQSDYQCEIFHSYLHYSSYKDPLAAVLQRISLA
jgi:hypothetical protein